MNRIATVVKGYPRLSETFIAQEILGLERRGVPQLLVSLRRPTDPFVHAMHSSIAAEVLYLPEYLRDDPKRVRQGRRFAEAQPGFAHALAAFKADYARDRTPNRQRRFGQACVLARELPDDIGWLHAHFLHTPASVTRYAALILGLPWSFSAHAKDIWTTPTWELREKLRDARWGVTCTRANLDYLASLATDPERLRLVYHGLDLSSFPGEIGAGPRGGSGFRIVSVGRAVEKKGFADLLKALGALRHDPSWTFEHVGGGPLTTRLKELAERLGLSSRIIWHGQRDRAFIFDLLRRADLFVLPSLVTPTGDRDGLPNVLMEAQLFAVPVLSTEISGIQELVTHGDNGWLVPPRNPPALAGAIATLMGDAALRERLGRAGAAHVRANFNAAAGIEAIEAMLRRGAAHREAA